jgi:hypothetical protein
MNTETAVDSMGVETPQMNVNLWKVPKLEDDADECCGIPKIAAISGVFANSPRVEEAGCWWWSWWW